MGVRQGGAHLPAVLDGLEGQVVVLKGVIAHEGAGAAVVDALVAQPGGELPEALGGQAAHGRAQEGVLLGAEIGGRVPAGGQQAHDDLRGVEVVEARGEHAGVEATVIAAHVLVQEGQAHPLLAGRGVELALPGGDEGGVEELEQVLALELVGGSHHWLRSALMMNGHG